jgi:hypothetical protein
MAFFLYQKEILVNVIIQLLSCTDIIQCSSVGGSLTIAKLLMIIGLCFWNFWARPSLWTRTSYWLFLNKEWMKKKTSHLKLCLLQGMDIKCMPSRPSLERWRTFNFHYFTTCILSCHARRGTGDESKQRWVLCTYQYYMFYLCLYVLELLLCVCVSLYCSTTNRATF